MVFGWTAFRVKGGSMRPALAPGDIVIARRKPFRSGDIVLCEHPRLGRIVKRVGADGCLQGDSAESTDRERLGPASDAGVRAVAVWVLTPEGLCRP